MIFFTYRRDAIILALLGLVIGAIMLIGLRNPGYTDAYYYFNAGQRLVQGKGLTDAAIWTYIGIPANAHLPIPSHLYWMPLASLVAALGMAIAGPTFDAARLFLIPLYASLGLIGFWLGATLGQSRRIAWIAGLLTLFSGYFMPYWMTTDTFAIYGVVGSLALITMGLGRKSGNWQWYALSGICSGLAHLARADGLLLVVVLVIVALWPAQKTAWQKRFGLALIGITAYLIVMLPWFIRNLNTVGAILPVGGFQTAWMQDYLEIFNYPPGVTLSHLLEWGAGNIIQSRWQGLTFGLQDFIAVEGIIILAPFMLLALWRRRRDPLLSGFWLYALGLHIAMTLVFRFPGELGGLLHSSSALVPFWAALGILGIDDAIAWIAPRRRWRIGEARRFFTVMLLIWAIGFSVLIFRAQTSQFNGRGAYFLKVADDLPADAIVMINDPSALYYFTGRAGIRLPTASDDMLPTLIAQYDVTHIVLDQAGTPDQLYHLYLGVNVPPFLTQVYADADVRIYQTSAAP